MVVEGTIAEHIVKIEQYTEIIYGITKREDNAYLQLKKCYMEHWKQPCCLGNYYWIH